ncbi:SigE family RNA polymerase sigma factor [Nakamurella lactea]|uniref:SigE family RNA polymerase sigma factor n=1 Tax=Nakamurella lactea TaxID=459515 RepID=UPI0003F71C8F|nr:SigE family RNA polymerase sigma factor [Nakamurella lactea]
MTGVDPAAAEYVRDAAPRLLRLAYGLAGNKADAEDLVQDALAAVMVKWHRVSVAEHTDAYARRILINRFLGLARRRRATEWVTDTRQDRFDTGRPDIADDVCSRDEVLALLAGLPSKQRAVLTLRYLEDLPDDKIAEILGCRTTSVRGLAHRAVGRIRESQAAMRGPAHGSPDLRTRPAIVR